MHQINLHCPKCDKSLMDAYKQIDGHPSIRLNIEINGEKGLIRLSSLYGSYNYLCSISTPEGEVATFSCPSCGVDLATEYACNECQAPLVEFKVSKGGKAVICSRGGCNNHNVGYKDLASTLNQFYKQHPYGHR